MIHFSLKLIVDRPKYKYSFRQIKLEIASAIPALNDCKIERKKSTAKGLDIDGKVLAVTASLICLFHIGLRYVGYSAGTTCPAAITRLVYIQSYF